MSWNVTAIREKRVIPTYDTGSPEINPLFFEKRVYQGSSGKVYPVPFIDKVFDHKKDRSYDTVTLENRYVRLVMLPEIGGRIFEAQDKTNHNYDFFYRQKVIKPALVGLAGPWISGGVEFNWPQHHRPGTFLPSAVFIEEETDGAKTVWMSEYDPMYRLKGMHGIRIRPGSALIELRGRLYNPTPLTHTFLWWANVAVEVHKDYQSFFPPDIHYVADHAVRAMSSFPFAENDYYGIPYHQRKGQNDLRNYENIPVPTSFMVCETGYDFFGGYDSKAEGGFIHVANRHIAPGKKQWTWGNDPFGRAWDRELTDEGGPYFELMAGVYTDNQPDFSYLMPYETKTFSQFWWSYKKLGPVQNAGKDLAIRLEILPGNRLDLGVAASRKFANLRVVLKTGNKQSTFERITVSPEDPWTDRSIQLESGQENVLSMSVTDAGGKELIAYTRCETSRTRNRKIAVEPAHPGEVKNNSELRLIAEHLELYRHPTRHPEPYLEEAISRDSSDAGSHTALGRIALKNGRFAEAEKLFSLAIDQMTRFHPNPENGEAYYFCGVACIFQDKLDEAYARFYKATWNYAWRSSAYYHLATIDCQKGAFDTALEHLENSLDTNRQNNKAHILKAIILKKQGAIKDAENVLYALLKTDPLDPWATFELGRINGSYSGFLSVSANDAQVITDMAFDYARAGFYKEAVTLIRFHQEHDVPECAVPNPMSRSAMTGFLLSWLLEKLGDHESSDAELIRASESTEDYFFPSRGDEQRVLEWAAGKSVNPSVALYGLGNYYYNGLRHDDAVHVWEAAANAGSRYGTLHRNLGIAYWNTRGDAQKARQAYQKAISLSPEDARIHYEFDQLRKKMNDSPDKRLADLLSIKELVTSRDDFSVELAALYNFEGQYNKALELLDSRSFHPWEGGEGQVLRQYTYACVMLGRNALMQGKPGLALTWFEKSMDIPDHLGEKYHPLQAVAHINYWKGMAYKALGNEEEAQASLSACILEEGDFIEMAVSTYSEMSYYKALALRELGKKEEARELFTRIREYGTSKAKEKAVIDYFATSLPLLLVFEEDLQKRNEMDAKYLIALAEAGLGNPENSRRLALEVLHMNAMHVGAMDLINTINLFGQQ